MSGFIGLLFKRMQLPPESDIAGKTIIITGSNTGIGKAAVQHALALGAAMIIMGVRTVSKGEQAKADIESSVSNAKGKIAVWPLDLESFESVQAFAAKARQHVADGGKIDIAIMNAGLASVEWARSPTGWEKGLQVNVLSTALLSIQLLHVLLATRAKNPVTLPHLTILTSDIHKFIKFQERYDSNILKTLNDEAQWKKSQAAGGATERYGVTKLFDMYIARTLASLVPTDKQGQPLVVVNAVTPGFCKSELLTREEAPLMLKVAQFLIARPVVEGSKTLLHGATQGVETHGKWLENESLADPGKIVTSAEAGKVQQQVWGEIVEVLRGVDPGLSTTFS